jgi:hypothetical protein
MPAEWMTVDLSLRGQLLGPITFYDGNIDVDEITEAEREVLKRVFDEYSAGKPIEPVASGFADHLEPVRHGQKTAAWFKDVLWALGPEGYSYTITDEGQRERPDDDSA